MVLAALTLLEVEIGAPGSQILSHRQASKQEESTLDLYVWIVLGGQSFAIVEALQALSSLRPIQSQS